MSARIDIFQMYAGLGAAPNNAPEDMRQGCIAPVLPIENLDCEPMLVSTDDHVEAPESPAAPFAPRPV